MSRCIQLALVLSIAACEHAPESTTPSVVTPGTEPTTTSTSSTAPVEPPPPRRVARPAAKPKPEPACKQVGSFQTRAGPKWVCDDQPARVRVVKEAK